MAARPGIPSLVVLAFLATFSARRAEACHEGAEAVGLFALLALPMNIGLTIHDFAADDSSREYALAEVLYAGTEVIAAVAVTRVAFGSCVFPEPHENPFLRGSTAKTFAIVMLAWGSALLIHGAWNLSRPRKSAGDPSPAAFMVTPALITDGVSLGTGISIVGRF